MDAQSRYHPDQDQTDLAETFSDALADLLPIARLHDAPMETDTIREQLTDLGLFSITRSEAEGGSGLGIVEECLIATTLGRQLVAPGIIATLGAQSLPGLPMGARVATACYEGGQRVAIDPQGADLLLLLRREDGPQLLPMEGLEFQPVETELWLSGLYSVTGSPTPLAEGDTRTLLRLRLIDAAVLAGLAHAAQDMGVAYAQVREQFGRPIGSFQAVKHSCANMAIATRSARDQVSFAAVALDAGRPDAALQVESALFVAIDAALDNAGRNIQIHGGMGFSDEADAHLVLKRARTFAAIAGGAEKALDRIAALPSPFLDG